jgi:hypothetical protein
VLKQAASLSCYEHASMFSRTCPKGTAGCGGKCLGMSPRNNSRLITSIVGCSIRGDLEVRVGNRTIFPNNGMILILICSAAFLFGIATRASPDPRTTSHNSSSRAFAARPSQNDCIPRQ